MGVGSARAFCECAEREERLTRLGCRFHDVEPMPGLEMMPPGPLSRVSRCARISRMPTASIPEKLPSCQPKQYPTEKRVPRMLLRSLRRMSHPAANNESSPQVVVSKAVQTVPYPLLGENTLVISDSMVLSRDENNNLALMFRWPHRCPQKTWFSLGY